MTAFGRLQPVTAGIGLRHEATVLREVPFMGEKAERNKGRK